MKIRDLLKEAVKINNSMSSYINKTYDQSDPDMKNFGKDFVNSLSPSSFDPKKSFIVVDYDDNETIFDKIESQIKKLKLKRKITRYKNQFSSSQYTTRHDYGDGILNMGDMWVINNSALEKHGIKY